ncbi:MAG: NAD(P)-binding protein [Proteobacteria bacterium]|nr:NAD(P)-binding protein [Pseudomonadota bacterium]
MIDLLILGGGIAGLSAAWAARERGLDALVLEARGSAGGILDSFSIDGFRFDNGVHLSFATEPEVRAVFDRTPHVEHEALCLCWDNGLWLRHPVQNNLYPLPVEEKVALIDGLVGQPEGEVRTYRDWLIQQYGGPMAARWPLVYTEKYWTLPAEKLGIDWIGQRMRRADLPEVLRGAMSERVPSTYYISRMRYPRRGGYRAFIEPMIEAATIRTGARVAAVDPRARQVRIDGGEVVGYRRLVSTLPLPSLVAMMDDVPDGIRADAESLFATRVDLISVALRRARVSPSLWFYIYDRDVLAARVYSPSWKSADNAPPGCSSLQWEIYSSCRRPIEATIAEMTENCLAAMERMGLAARDDVIFTHHKYLPFGNVVFDLGMEARRDRVRGWVEAQGIGLAGRFGEWAYLWSNQSFMSGRSAVERLVPVAA